MAGRAEVHASLLPRLRSALDALAGGPNDREGTLVEVDLRVAESEQLAQSQARERSKLHQPRL
jgi:hypothetical protein